jgi:hypothetical protein
MSRLKVLASILLVGLSLIACSTVQVSVDYDPAIRFETLRTYDWKPEPEEKAGDPLIDTDTLLRQRVVSAIEGEMTRRGYHRVRKNPDFLLAFFFTRERVVGAPYYAYPYYGGFFGGPYYGYWGGWFYPGYYGPNGYARGYDERLLVIDFVDPASRKLLWRGLARDYPRFQETPEAKDRRISEAVSAVLQRFPPR